MSNFSEIDIDRQNESREAEGGYLRTADGRVWVTLEAFRALAAEASALGGRIVDLEERLAALTREKG